MSLFNVTFASSTHSSEKPRNIAFAGFDYTLKLFNSGAFSAITLREQEIIYGDGAVQ